ncbi:MAG: hypothetical protein J7M26_00740, partial [Armatimonadetes bacterium]|nr:hypothetical protein [Armatimonadota bacterium]
LVMYGYGDNQRALWGDAFKHFNIVTGQTRDPELVRNLRRQGVLFAYHVTNTPDEGRTTADEFAEYWSRPFRQTFADRLPGGFDAISIDEFHSAPDGSEESERAIRALRKLRKQYPDRIIIGWGVWRLADGGPQSLYGAPKVTYDRQLEAIRDCCDLFILEHYVREGNPQLDLTEAFANNLARRCPGLLKKTIFGLYISQSEPYIADDSTAYDFKGFLEEQIRVIRADRLASEMPGVAFWAFYRANMDTLIWAGQLVEHYYRRGKRSQLHPHGPRQLLGDGSFELLAGGAGAEARSPWQLRPAADGTCRVAKYEDLPLASPAHGSVKHGQWALAMTATTTGRNVAFQDLKLKPGEWYAVTAYVNTRRATDLDVEGPRREEKTELLSVTRDKWGAWQRMGRAFRAPRDGEVRVVLRDEVAANRRVAVWDFVEIEWLPPNCRPLKTLAAVWDGLHVLCRGENLAPGSGATIGQYELEPAEWKGFQEASWLARVGMSFAQPLLQVTWPEASLLPYSDTCKVITRY